MNFLVDGLGVLGIATTVMIFQQKERKPLLYWKLATDFIWLLHYLLLGAYSACVTTAVSIFRSAVFLHADRKWAQSPAWLYIFLGASLGLTLLVWQDMYSLLTLTGSFLSIIAYWMKNPRITRFLSVPSAACILVYNIAYHSREGVLCDTFLIISAIVGIVRYDIRKKALPALSKAQASGRRHRGEQAVRSPKGTPKQTEPLFLPVPAEDPAKDPNDQNGA